tara:strand:- start:5903 stop:7321 length:1419 start_codon:yes stop_codon:yes gene_type:complete
VARWLVLDVFVLLAGLWLGWRMWQTGAVRVSTPHLWALAVLGWFTLSLSWSSDPLQGAVQLQHGLALFVVFMAAPYLTNLRWPITAAYAGALALAFTLPNGGFGNENFITEWLLIAAPLVHRRAWPLLGIAAVYLLFFNESRLEFLVLWGAVLWLAFRHPSRGIFPGIAVLLSAGIVFLVNDGYFTHSLNPRIELGANTVALWWEAPLAGHGLGSFSYEYPRLQEWHLGIFPWVGTILLGDLTMGAAHNDWFQLLAEGGAVALVLAAGLFFTLPGRDRRIWAAIAIAALLALVDFPLQNPQTAFLAALVLGLAAGQGRRVSFPPLTAPAAVLPGLACLVSGTLLYAAHVERAKGTMARNAGAPFLALRHALDAYELHPGPWKIRMQLPLAFNTALAAQEQPTTVKWEAVEELFRIGASASPWAPGLLITRLEYLLAAGSNAAQMAAIAAYLEAHASRLPETRKILARYEERT